MPALLCPRALARLLLAALLALAVALPLSLAAARPAAAATTTVAARAATIAPHYLGVPYRYGGTTPRGFDCSGYTGYVYARAGHRLPRTSGQQYAATRRISHAAMRPGDLVFFRSGSHVYHVGIYAGRGMLWHAPRPGQRVRLQKLWTTAWSGGRVG